MAEKIVTKRDLKAFHTAAKAIVKRIADARDDLRNLMSDYADILNSTDGALDEFEGVIDKLSELL